MNSNQEDRIDTEQQVRDLVGRLNNQDGLGRQRARLALVEIGHPATPYLIAALNNKDKRVRWEAAEALAEIGDPAGAAPLVQHLKDNDMNVRWAALRALIALDRAALPPLLEALTVDFSSPWLRQGAHHVLHALGKAGGLTKEEAKVFDNLKGPFPNTQQLPWHAEAALVALEDERIGYVSPGGG